MSGLHLYAAVQIFRLPNFAQWTAGASRLPAFPAPSFIEGKALRQSSGDMSREDAKVCLLFEKRCQTMPRTPIQHRHPEVLDLRRACAASRASKGDGPAASRPFILRGSACDAFASQASHLRMTEWVLSPRRDSGLLPPSLKLRRTSRCARNDDVEASVRENWVSCPGRSAASLRRCAAEPGPMQHRAPWLPGSRLCATPLRAASRPGHERDELHHARTCRA
ncbi:hypothetical protein AB7M17_007617 [Bradyrhizobium sp. USDA 377]